MRGRLLVAAILAVALVARLGLALGHDAPPLTGDPLDYDRHATAIAEQGNYPQSAIAVGGGPSAFRPPGYPLALAAVYALGGRGEPARVFGALLGTLAIALLGLVAFQLFGRRTALAAMALGAAFPPLIMVSVAQLSETLFIVVVLGALACVLRAPHRLAWVATAGALAGAAALTRTNGLVILLPLLLAARGTRPRVALLAAALVVLVPWSVRSSTALDAFVPTTTQAGFALAGAYNDRSRDDPEFPAAWRPPTMAPYAALRRPGRDEAELESDFRGEAIDFAIEHPTYPLVVVYRASTRMLNLADADLERHATRESGVGWRWADANRYAFWAVALLAIAGALTAAARGAPRWLWLFPVLLWLSVAITIGTTRYRTPVDPFVLMLAALGLTRWRRA
jgi:4-amino-4-deoxy-L-arabinose transferase-like glycosyltransferase